MRILLTNDDGIYAPGIHALYMALREAGHLVHVVAPLAEKSGASAALTVRTPLRVHQVKHNGLVGQAVDGTPVDCVKLAINALLDDRPDLVVAGLNNGANLGADVFYSGTVAAASEGSRFGLPSVALSRGRPAADPPSVCAAHAARLISDFNWASLPSYTMINVNYPRHAVSQLRGVRVGRMALKAWNEGYERRVAPSGQPYWWLTGDLNFQVDDDTDIALVRSGYVALTPLVFDRTAQECFDRLHGVYNK